MIDFLREAEEKRLKWSLKTFTEATPMSSLIKAQGEIMEVAANIETGVKDPEEYADVMMCLFDSAARDGISYQDIVDAYRKKVEINIKRDWTKNDDNTYSHVKK